jgi:hypothetical protein
LDDLIQLSLHISLTREESSASPSLHTFTASHSH